MFRSLINNTSRASIFTTALLAMPLTSCGAIAGSYDATTTFLVNPHASGTFNGWSEITISQDANSVSGATLDWARLDLPQDSPASDLTFIKDVSATIGDAKVPIAEQDTMPKGETDVLLDMLYDGDLRQFFKDGHTVHIDWKGTRNPDVAIPEGGLWVEVRVRVTVK
ncbi:MAG: hypothetical protein U0441_08425 [Polyangiaceae bacterium]